MLRAFVLTACVTLLVNPQAIPRNKQPDVRYVPTPQNVVDRMLALARVTSADIVYDLGSGDGRIPITAARTYGAIGVGIEVDSFYVRQAVANARDVGVEGRVRFLNQDLFEADIREATVVTLFLLPQVNERLAPKLRRDLRPGTRVVSHQYRMGDDWPPDESEDVGGLTIYMWTIPDK
jgi:SAM-dependent methyltransferase